VLYKLLAPEVHADDAGTAEIGDEESGEPRGELAA
jgi:hypothetical protein